MPPRWQPGSTPIAGEPDEAARCLDAADRGLADRRRTTAKRYRRTRLARPRGHRCGEPRRDAQGRQEAALEHLPADDPWRPYALLLQGRRVACCSRTPASPTVLFDWRPTPPSNSARPRPGRSPHRARPLADARGDHARADACLARIARAGDPLDRFARTPSPWPHRPEGSCATAAGRRLAARSRRAAPGCPGLSEALPWLAVQTRLELAGAMGDAPRSRRCAYAARRSRRIFAVHPKLGTPLPAARLARGRARRDAVRGSGGTVRLTAAELRLLPLLATHLSFREIGAHFFLSRHTVKTQAISAYRKLGRVEQERGGATCRAARSDRDDDGVPHPPWSRADDVRTAAPSPRPISRDASEGTPGGTRTRGNGCHRSPRRSSPRPRSARARSPKPTSSTGSGRLRARPSR